MLRIFVGSILLLLSSCSDPQTTKPTEAEVQERNFIYRCNTSGHTMTRCRELWKEQKPQP
ncbi:MAG: hypothetical protein NTV97_16225 [Alphaproteobacteria bacterium]|nr:hypothetical protein [Alphaproteobacteria bacterium]